MDDIFHIATKGAWHAAQDAGPYEVESLRTEGFIHCSTIEQVADTASRVFRGRTDLVLLRIDATRVAPEVRYELAPDVGGAFPHIYGPLNLDAVVEVISFPPREDGSFALPS